MENYAYSASSYPNSGNSSPRSRDIDFENPPPWEDNSKLKFMCSYGGKIHPRPHDNQLSYVGGETKILAVDRKINFAGMISKLSALCDAAEVCFKYQLPGEDLDALISVSNDDDLEHMIHEYDGLSRVSAKPVRLKLRLFLFPASSSADPPSRFGSTEMKSENDRFVDALNSGPIRPSPLPSTVAPSGHVDFLFGLDKGMPPPVASKFQNQMPESPSSEKEIPVPGAEGQVIGPDSIQAQIKELQRLQIGGPEQAVYRGRSDDNFVGGYAGDHYYQKMPEKVPPAQVQAQATMHSAISAPAGYWTQKQVAGGSFPANSTGAEQPIYMIPSPANVYHAPVGRPVTGPAGQGYYAVQRMAPEVYREQQPVYNVVPSMAAPTAALTAQPLPKSAAYSEGMGMAVRPPNNGGMGGNDSGYAQVAYNNGMGRQVFYTAPGV